VSLVEGARFSGRIDMDGAEAAASGDVPRTEPRAKSASGGK
jgi:hypothetical protein